MKTLLLFLLLLSPPALAQSYWPPPGGDPIALKDSLQKTRDTLKIERKQFIQSGSDNTALKAQIARQADRSARFWGLIILAIITTLAQSAAGH